MPFLIGPVVIAIAAALAAAFVIRFLVQDRVIRRMRRNTVARAARLRETNGG